MLSIIIDSMYYLIMEAITYECMLISSLYTLFLWFSNFIRETSFQTLHGVLNIYNQVQVKLLGQKV